MLAAFYLLALFFDLDKNVPTTEAFMYICTYGEENRRFLSPGSSLISLVSKCKLTEPIQILLEWTVEFSNMTAYKIHQK